MVLYQSRHDATEYGRLAQLVEHLLDVQEVTGSSPVPSTKPRASDLGQRLFCCVTHQPTSEQDGTGLEQQRSRPPPAAETGRRGWGRVLIFQGPVKGLRKNQQTQLVRAAHLSYSFFRNVYQESSACRSTICTASVGRDRTGTMYVRAIRKKQRQVITMAVCPAFYCLLGIGVAFRLAVWYTRLNKSEFTST